MQTKIQIRFVCDDEIALGPGKIELLDAIARTGSISQAAKTMNMSYRRAWQLVDTMNRHFVSPVVQTQTGGTHGGGAVVTELGLELILQFRCMEQQAREAIATTVQLIQKNLKKSD